MLRWISSRFNCVVTIVDCVNIVFVLLCGIQYQGDCFVNITKIIAKNKIEYLLYHSFFCKLFSKPFYYSETQYIDNFTSIFVEITKISWYQTIDTREILLAVWNSYSRLHLCLLRNLTTRIREKCPNPRNLFAFADI